MSSAPETTGCVLALALCACSGAGAAAPTPSPEPEAPSPPIVVALRWLEAPPSSAPEPRRSEDPPRTRILLVIIDPDRGRSTHDLGTYRGVCTPSRGALLAADCWWAGAGAAVRVVRQGDRLLASRLEVGPLGGRSSEVVIARVPLPEGARIETL